jgi:D-alanyl-D-alanine carboxypeptidase/D-alanyl-D-alanine-endopeptidase (penicillin-binding protein 4)
VKQLLYFSNNFTANQLLLILGAEQFGTPADLSKGQKALHDFLVQSIGLKNFSLTEGSGLSRSNRFSARQIIKVLQHFEPYHFLLRDYDEKFLAKTGTLKGVSTFAGYMLSPENENIPFVIMLENPGRFDYRYKIAEQLYDFLFQK